MHQSALSTQFNHYCEDLGTGGSARDDRGEHSTCYLYNCTLTNTHRRRDSTLCTDTVQSLLRKPGYTGSARQDKNRGESCDSSKQGKPGTGPGADEAPVRSPLADDTAQIIVGQMNRWSALAMWSSSKRSK